MTHSSTCRGLGAQRLLKACIALGGCHVAVTGSAGTWVSDFMETFHREMARQMTAGKATVAILDDTGWMGSGVVINPGDFTGDGFDDFTDSRWVLTAAHVLNGGSGFWVGTGDSINDLVTYRAEEWYFPNAYDGEVISEYDIALIRLDRGIANNIPRMNLQAPGDPFETGKVHTAFGFGSTGNGLTGRIRAGGIKHAGRNKFDSAEGSNDRILTYDMDVDPDDPLYNFLLHEQYYADLHDIPFEDWFNGEVNPRRDPGNDFRIPYEYQTASGDSGGPIVIGDRVSGIVSYGDSLSQFTGISGDVRVSQWYNWIYGVIFQHQGGVPVIGFGPDGVAIGSQGNPINAGLGTEEVSGDTEANVSNIRANYRRHAQLLSNYFNPDQGVTLQEAIELLDLQPAEETIEAYADALGVDPATLDPVTAEQQLLDAAYALLDSTIDPSLKYVARGSIGEFGFLKGLAQVGTPTQQWGGGSSEGVDLSDYFDFIDLPAPPANYLYGDVNVNGSIEVGDIDALYAMINVGGDAAFDPNGDLDFSGNIARPDVDALVYGVLNTEYGDADLDGDIDFDDAAALVLNFTGTAGEADQITWARANFDGDKDVDFGDAVVLRVNYTGSDAASGDGASAVGTDVALIVDVVTGEITVVGDSVLLKGVSITSLSGALAGDAATAGVFTLSETANEYAMISIGGLLVDGELSLDAAFAGGLTDLGFRYITDSGVFTGQVSYVPEPAIAVAALGLALLDRRRRA